MNVLDLQGSPAKDLFNRKHKTHMPSQFYACDLDLILFDKRKGIVAILDYKNPETDSNPTFVSCKVYDQLKQALDVPVYLVYATPPNFEAVKIEEYLGFSDNPLRIKKRFVLQGTWQDFIAFEKGLRQ